MRRQTSASNGISGTTNYLYDGDGRRVKKSSGTLYWYGAGGEVLSETALDGSNPVDYVYFGGKRLARVTSSPQRSVNYSKYSSPHGPIITY